MIYKTYTHVSVMLRSHLLFDCRLAAVNSDIGWFLRQSYRQSQYFWGLRFAVEC